MSALRNNSQPAKNAKPRMHYRCHRYRESVGPNPLSRAKIVNCCVQGKALIENEAHVLSAIRTESGAAQSVAAGDTDSEPLSRGAAGAAMLQLQKRF